MKQEYRNQDTSKTKQEQSSSEMSNKKQEYGTLCSQGMSNTKPGFHIQGMHNTTDNQTFLMQDMYL